MACVATLISNTEKQYHSIFLSFFQKCCDTSMYSYGKKPCATSPARADFQSVYRAEKKGLLFGQDTDKCPRQREMALLISYPVQP
jgi:hypothetical protein